ncbi:MAG TPA: hypothetical protein VGC95_04705 [Chitinophagaceae bacterium]|jgi:hypothetical protein
MNKETFEKMSMEDLCGHLADKTLKLLEAIDRKLDGVTLRNLKQEVEKLQNLIDERRAQKA